MFIPRNFIQVNLPLTEDDYLSGNGEGVWVKVDPATRQAYDADRIGPGYSGILDNVSLYYPGLDPGELIPFELRGKCRPVADYRGFLSRHRKLTPAEKVQLLMRIAKNREKEMEGNP